MYSTWIAQYWTTLCNTENICTKSVCYKLCLTFKCIWINLESFKSEFHSTANHSESLIQISVMDSTVSQIHHSQICFPFTVNGQQVKETVIISLCKNSLNRCWSSESLKHLTDYFSKATWTARYTDTQQLWVFSFWSSADNFFSLIIFFHSVYFSHF